MNEAIERTYRRINLLNHRLGGACGVAALLLQNNKVPMLVGQRLAHLLVFEVTTQALATLVMLRTESFRFCVLAIS